MDNATKLQSFTAITMGNAYETNWQIKTLVFCKHKVELY